VKRQQLLVGKLAQNQEQMTNGKLGAMSRFFFRDINKYI
jgi:hypothetical protein